MAEPQATLLISPGTHGVRREDLARIATPSVTPTFTPIPYAALVEEVSRALQRRHVVIEREEIAVTQSGGVLFGVMDLQYGQTQEGRAALGLRSSHNRRLAVQIAVGHRVLVCDNLAFSGDLIALRRRHTGQVDLEKEVERAVGNFLLAYRGLAEDVQRLKARPLSDDDARQWILRVLREGAVPGRYVGMVLDNYFECPLPAFRERTLWSLHNAFTSAFQRMPPAVAFHATATLGRVFELGAVGGGGLSSRVVD